MRGEAIRRPQAQPAIDLAAMAWGVNPEEVLSVSRLQSVADARALAMWLIRRTLGYSYPELGRIFGRDHSTCITAVRKVERAIVTGQPERLARVARGVSVTE